MEKQVFASGKTEVIGDSLVRTGVVRCLDGGEFPGAGLPKVVSLDGGL